MFDLFLQKLDSITVEIDKENHIFRNRQTVDGLVDQTSSPQLEKSKATIHKIWSEVVKNHSHKPIFGYRPLKKIHVKEINSKKWSYFELDDYQWMNYREANDKVHRIAMTLQKQGLKRGDIMLLFCKTRAEWMMTALACFTLGIVITTAYDSMNAEAISHIIKETEAKAVFTEASLSGTLNKVYRTLDTSEQPPFVLWAGQACEAPDDIQLFHETNNKTTFVHFDDIENEELTVQPDDESSCPSDLALIMYTSGSTGTPKGVELTHANLVAACGAAQYNISDILVGFEHRYVAYLPLAHVLEFIIEIIMISLAIPVGYSSVRTLMNEFICGPDGEGKGTGDLKTLKPSIMVGVPAVWERIKKGVETKLNQQHWTIQKVFQGAVELKWNMLKYFGKSNMVTDTLDTIMFGAIRDVTGGNLKYCFTGGAPLSLETQKFITSTLALMLQGYGLTECCGLGAMTHPRLGMVTSVIGPPSPCMEFRLVDVPDYEAKDNVGELWLRGPSLLRGYYKRPELTREAITPEGWFKTGDVARLNPDGTFSICDRVKNLVKLAHGEYIALESLESNYRNCREIKNICIVADSSKSYVVGVVEPEDDGVDKDKLLKDLQETAKAAGCSRVEIVQDIVVTRHIDWIAEYTTSSGKIKRRDIAKTQKDEIEKIYT